MTTGVHMAKDTVLERAPSDIDAMSALYAGGEIRSYIPILPVLSLKGKPYSLVDYAPFEPIYSLDVPQNMLYKCGRQVAKTTNMSAQAVLQLGTTPHFSMLFVAPRYEQIRRVSSNYVRPFIEQSFIAQQLVNKRVENSVLQRTFLNESRMYFSFAFLDVDRIRGLSVDCVNYDEIQDIDIDFVPIIRECMSASPFQLQRWYGTPKTLDNTIQVLWEQSSQAEWHVKCHACGLINIPSAEHHLAKMIGLLGPICAKCGKLVNPRTGQWVHAVPERRSSHAGYHVPQIVLPMHYEDPDKSGQMPTERSMMWQSLLDKQDGLGGYDTTKFMNEVLGESSDIGVKLVTLTDIKTASRLNKNEWRDALDRCGDYLYRVLAVDWGGGGEDFVSTTTYAVLGLNIKTRTMDCIYAKRMTGAIGHHDEARILIDVFKAFQCHMFAHDYGGAGSVRETLMIQAGLPLQVIIPFMYVRASAKKMVEIHRPAGHQQRSYYTLDKARSLVLQATAIKAGNVLLPEYNSSKNVTHDLLSLVEDRRESPGRADIFLVTRNAKMTDDFAHALNFGCVAIWHTWNCYPDLSKVLAIKLTAAQADFVNPPNVTFDDSIS